MIKPLDDPVVSRLVEIARRCPVLQKCPLKLSTKQRGKNSAYGNNEVLVAITGSKEIAELNAGFLQEMGYNTGSVWDCTERELEELLNGQKGKALIQPVSLGGGSFVSIDSISACTFRDFGSARGTAPVGARKMPTGSKVECSTAD